VTTKKYHEIEPTSACEDSGWMSNDFDESKNVFRLKRSEKRQVRNIAVVDDLQETSIKSFDLRFEILTMAETGKFVDFLQVLFWSLIL
jgi:hypothetical protein